MHVDEDRIDRIIEETRKRVDRMNVLTAQTQALLKAGGDISGVREQDDADARAADRFRQAAPSNSARE
jgi:hypothetical protein